MEPVLSPSEVKGWANQLSSYWYPSFNTDLIPPGPTWPDEQTEADIKAELGGRSFASPTFVLRGKPQGKATYNVFLVRTPGAEAQASAAPSKPALKLAKTRPTPAPGLVIETVQRELAAQGGSWPKWTEKVAPAQAQLKKRLKAMPPKVKALAGHDGFLFYRNDLEYVTGGDLEKQRKGKNPLPIIVEFKKLLDQQGVDFLFVPVPTKLEVYPEELDPELKAFSGQVINPAFRKLLASLAKEGVEVFDLLPALLREKSAKGPEPLFQHQDTHWTDRGLRFSAELLATRVKKYPWYEELAKQKRSYELRETSFTRFGDLQSRLPEAEQKKYTPETLVAHQVLAERQALRRRSGQPRRALGRQLHRRLRADRRGARGRLCAHCAWHRLPSRLGHELRRRPQRATEVAAPRSRSARHEEARDLDDDGARSVQLLGGLGAAEEAMKRRSLLLLLASQRLPARDAVRASVWVERCWKSRARADWTSERLSGSLAELTRLAALAQSALARQPRALTGLGIERADLRAVGLRS